MERRQLRQLRKDLSTIPGFGEPQRPPPHKAKDFLGAAVTGLCGSDVKQILLNGARDNPLTALVSFPHDVPQSPDHCAALCWPSCFGD
jgi:hypothetical protein